MTVVDEAAATAVAMRFPAGYRFGAATASYQIEGAVTADGRGQSIWDTYAHTSGRIRNGDTGDVACDHYHRWEADLDLMASVGLRAYRFSIAWPRIQPAGRGSPNAAGLDHYDRLVDGLLARGIEPWATLYHWDLPQALEDGGGWTSPEAVERLAEYASVVARRLGDRVGHWITLNEPRTHSLMGYGVGRHAPGRTGWASAVRAAHHMHLAHAGATRAIRASAPAARVGVCHDVNLVVPASERAEDVAAALRHDGALHRWFLDPTFGRGYPDDVAAWYDAHGFLDGIDVDAVRPAEPIDFLAVNYYRRERVVDAPVRDGWGIGSAVLEDGGERSGNGWEVWPDGLREVLVRVRDDYAPAEMAITENGATYDDPPPVDGTVEDEPRRSYLERHLHALADARDAGVPVEAYFVWSLFDNFEWAEGYTKRFGVVHVDFATQQRTLKASGRFYANILRHTRG